MPESNVKISVSLLNDNRPEYPGIQVIMILPLTYLMKSKRPRTPRCNAAAGIKNFSFFGGSAFLNARTRIHLMSRVHGGSRPRRLGTHIFERNRLSGLNGQT